MATFYQVELNDIENVNYSDLESAKLQALENSYDSFDYQVNQCSDANAIALSKGSNPYEILNGRHRIYLARQKGWRTIRARFA
jgi:hypothetical protein